MEPSIYCFFYVCRMIRCISWGRPVAIYTTWPIGLWLSWLIRPFGPTAPMICRVIALHISVQSSLNSIRSSVQSVASGHVDMDMCCSNERNSIVTVTVTLFIDYYRWCRARIRRCHLVLWFLGAHQDQGKAGDLQHERRRPHQNMHQHRQQRCNNIAFAIEYCRVTDWWLILSRPKITLTTASSGKIWTVMVTWMP